MKKAYHNHLDLLFVKYGTQSKGIGKKIWFEIEKLYPETKVWETYTPYFEKEIFIFMSMYVDFVLLNFLMKNILCQILLRILLEMEMKGCLNLENKCNLRIP